MVLSMWYKVFFVEFRLGQANLPLSAVANQMKKQIPQGGSIIGISSISALVGGELQWFV